MSESRLNYIKNVLGIGSVMVPENLKLKGRELKFHYQVMNNGNVLFTSEGQEQFSIEELQMIEKIIFALKLNIQKVDIAKYEGPILLQNKYDYIFMFGEEDKSLLNTEKVFKGFRIFYSFGTDQMIKNPELKKSAWQGFQKIMENLPK